MSYGSSTWRPWGLDEAETKPFYRKALDPGINFFDTAWQIQQVESPYRPHAVKGH